jgi:metallophosphoesterase (TIGR00282 family)
MQSQYESGASADDAGLSTQKSLEPVPQSGALLRILFVGDIVGKPGVELVCHSIPVLREQHNLDLVIVNGENAEDGSGITKAIFRRLMEHGVDGVTLGDHIYRKREIIQVLESDAPIVRPANYPPEAPGRDWMCLTTSSGLKFCVVSLMGRVFMKPVDCPFHAADRIWPQLPADRCGVLVDFHAEATSDKQLMGRYLDGRASAVLGTHTHVTTADEQIFPGGTAFQCDVGMTGPHHGIIGRRYDRVMETTLTQRPTSFNVAKGDNRLSGTLVVVDAATQKAKAIERIKVDES